MIVLHNTFHLLPSLANLDLAFRLQILQPENHPQLRPLFVNMSQRPKRAIISKTKGNMCLESVLIDSWAEFTPKVTSIRDSRVKFQISGANMVVTHVRMVPQNINLEQVG